MTDGLTDRQTYGKQIKNPLPGNRVGDLLLTIVLFFSLWFLDGPVNKLLVKSAFA